MFTRKFRLIRPSRYNYGANLKMAKCLQINASLISVVDISAYRWLYVYIWCRWVQSVMMPLMAFDCRVLSMGLWRERLSLQVCGYEGVSARVSGGLVIMPSVDEMEWNGALFTVINRLISTGLKCAIVTWNWPKSRGIFLLKLFSMHEASTRNQKLF